MGVEEVRGRRKEGLSGFVDSVLFSMGHSQDRQTPSFIGEEHGLWGQLQPGLEAQPLPLINVGTYCYASVSSLIQCR